MKMILEFTTGDLGQPRFRETLLALAAIGAPEEVAVVEVEEEIQIELPQPEDPYAWADSIPPQPKLSWKPREAMAAFDFCSQRKSFDEIAPYLGEHRRANTAAGDLDYPRAFWRQFEDNRPTPTRFAHRPQAIKKWRAYYRAYKRHYNEEPNA